MKGSTIFSAEAVNDEHSKPPTPINSAEAVEISKIFSAEAVKDKSTTHAAAINSSKDVESKTNFSTEAVNEESTTPMATFNSAKTVKDNSLVSAEAAKDESTTLSAPTNLSVTVQSKTNFPTETAKDEPTIPKFTINSTNAVKNSPILAVEAVKDESSTPAAPNENKIETNKNLKTNNPEEISNKSRPAADVEVDRTLNPVSKVTTVKEAGEGLVTSTIQTLSMEPKTSLDTNSTKNNTPKSDAIGEDTVNAGKPIDFFKHVA